MFGEEPYGNYNRILLSDVLNGSHEAEDIFLNPLAWYADNGIKLHAGVKVSKILRHAQQIEAEGGLVESYDKLIIATGSLPFIPPMDGLKLPDGSDKPGVFVFRNFGGLSQDHRLRDGQKTRRGDRRGACSVLEAARGLAEFLARRARDSARQRDHGPAAGRSRPPRS